MRGQLELQTGWWVSTSEQDARLAAKGRWRKRDLQLADDPENQPRKIDLPGGWQYGKRPLGAAGEVRLPAHYLCYARRIRVPKSWAGQTCLLHLNNARYDVTVQLNGETVGHYAGGLEPHCFDVTAFLHPGADNELLLTVGDVGVSGHRHFDPHHFTGTRLPTCREIENNLVHPVQYGGSDGRGVEQVTLAAVPPVRVAHVFANPKVAAGLLRYTVALTNDRDHRVTVRVRSRASASALNLPDLIAPGTVPAKRLIDRTLTLEPHSVRNVTADVPWPDARHWDTDDPFQYDLVTDLLADNRRLDRHRDSFGFREFTINGHDFILNGKKIHLLGQSGHVGAPQHAMSLADKIAFLRIAKDEGNLNHVRLHARPMDRRWVLAADRVGMLITTETALWTTGFHSFDWAGSEEACYENVRHHFLEALVRRDRNSPSVVIWSLSNEMSPITPWDLEHPKMAAMTRVFRRILAETAAEDDSRVTQMSSAMDFLGNLAMYNLHYPKNWQAYPDYPHTAYWLDGAFKFPWYGAGFAHLPSWSWRRDKPLYFGEYTCVHGATPDNQASIVGDIAFEESDFGSRRVQEKLWWMEAQAYRRQDVSGFCGWSFLLGNETDCRRLLARPDAAAYARAIRPLAVLDHNYHTDYLAGAEIALPLSIHNDTRHAVALALHCQALIEGEIIATESMPARLLEPGASVAFTNRFLAPAIDQRGQVEYRAALTRDDEVVDAWQKTLTVWPRHAGLRLPDDFGLYDPGDRLADRLAARGIAGGRVVRQLDAATLSGLKALWLGFRDGQANTGDWRRWREELRRFVNAGGNVILDQAPAAVLQELPVAIENGKGFAADNRLEITYAYPRAPYHPVLEGFDDADFALWGEDYYVARRCLEIPQEGNAVPVLVAGTDSNGLSSSPLLELRYGRGSYVVSTLEILSKLAEAPAPARLLAALAAYRPAWGTPSVGVSLDNASWQRLLEVGFTGENVDLETALAADIAVITGAQLGDRQVDGIRAALDRGQTVCIHELDEAGTTSLLRALGLPGEVLSGAAAPREWDIFRHGHALANGMTHNYLYWIVDKASVAPWTLAPTHPQPASALIRLPGDAVGAVSLTRRGAVTVYSVGPGTLVIDNLRWQLSNFDEPERPRRYLRCLLTNLGVPLLRGVDKRMAENYETEAERRERGHF